MNVNSLKLLRICAFIMGWALLVGISAQIWGWINFYREALDYSEGFVAAVAEFDDLKSISNFLFAFGSAFFAFLIASVFRMIEKEAPHGQAIAQSLMIVCCFSYVADALVRFGSLIRHFSEKMLVFNSPDLGSFLFSASSAVSPLVPVLYAASIFVLFTHFTKMVTFESEVA